MKRIIYILAVMMSGTLFFSSCSDDNYDEPNSGITGHFIDADTSEPVPMPIQGHGGSVKLRMYERDRFYSTGSDHSEMPVDFNAQIDGSYKNTWMFSSDYLMTFEQENFYPVDTVRVSLNGGKTTEYDIKVTPYARISIVKAEINQTASGNDITSRNLKVSYKINRSRNDYKIQSGFLAWHISPYIDNASGNSTGKSTVDYNSIADTQLLDTELVQTIDLLNDNGFNDQTNVSIIKGNSNQIFVRIGIITNGKINYSKVVSVPVTFVNNK